VDGVCAVCAKVCGLAVGHTICANGICAICTYNQNLTANLVVPAGVTHDLNGKVVTANNVLSFGVVMDSQTKVGGIRIPIDTAKAFTKLQPENGGYLPICDTRVGMYKFFAYELVNAGAYTQDGKAVFAFKFQLANMDAYSVLSAPEYSGVSLTIIKVRGFLCK
jgi:hypothetical protein